MSVRDSSGEAPLATIAIAATFTAEPIEPTLRFWTGELAMPARILFAPYNQPFQQLLDPASLLRTNGSGLNVILVRLQDRGGVGRRAGRGRPCPGLRTGPERGGRARARAVPGLCLPRPARRG